MEKYTSTVRTEALYALIDVLNTLHVADEYQMVDIGIHGGNIYLKLRHSETRKARDDGEFTHSQEFEINSYGITEYFEKTPL
jgi:hypothetical protein